MHRRSAWRLYRDADGARVASVRTPAPDGGNVSRPRVASQRFRRSPASPEETARRQAWGKEWGRVGAAVGKAIREGRA